MTILSTSLLLFLHIFLMAYLLLTFNGLLIKRFPWLSLHHCIILYNANHVAQRVSHQVGKSMPYVSTEEKSHLSIRDLFWPYLGASNTPYLGSDVTFLQTKWRSRSWFVFVFQCEFTPFTIKNHFYGTLNGKILP